MTTDDHSPFSERPNADPPVSSTADFDEAAYLPYLDDFALSDEQKREYLAIVWDIARFFVQTDIPAEIWGQILDPLTNPTATDSDGVKSFRTHGGKQSPQEGNHETETR